MEPKIETRIEAAKRQRKFRAVKKQQVVMLKVFYEFIKEKDVSLVKEFLASYEQQGSLPPQTLSRKEIEDTSSIAKQSVYNP